MEALVQLVWRQLRDVNQGVISAQCSESQSKEIKTKSG